MLAKGAPAGNGTVKIYNKMSLLLTAFEQNFTGKFIYALVEALNGDKVLIKMC